MATRGPNNFDNDGAREYLALRTAQLVAVISEVISSKQRLRPDEDGEAMLMPSVELLALVCERYGAVPPKLALVRGWSDKYLAAFDKSPPADVATPEFRHERRRAIERTFRWLERLAENHWHQG